MPLGLIPPVFPQAGMPEISAVLRAGPEDGASFRRALAGYLGLSAQGGLWLAASGRAALYLLLGQLAAGAGTANGERREVVLPAYTCPAIARVALDLGLKVRPVDVSTADLAMDPDGLGQVVSQRTLAVVHVHPFGIPLPLEPAATLAQEAGAALVEDAAQSMGARFVAPAPMTGSVGTLGDYGLFSLGPGKPLGCGGGGVLVTRHEMRAALLGRAWGQDRPPGRLRSVWSKAEGLLRLGLPMLAFRPLVWRMLARLSLNRVGDSEASWRYRVTGLPPAQAAAGLALLPSLDEVNARRRQTGEKLIEALARFDGLRPLRIRAGCEPIYLRLPVLAASQALRETLIRSLSRNGVGGGRMYGRTLASTFPATADQAYPGAEEVASRLITLPTHMLVSERVIDRIVAACQAAGA